MQIILQLTAVAFFFLFSDVGARAADSPPANPGSAKEEFQKIHAEFNTINGELRNLQVEYRKASKEDKPAVEKKWKAAFRQGEEMQAKYFQAAEKAFMEAPNADKEITKLLWNIFGYLISIDDYENAARLGKLLIDNGNTDNQGCALAGVAAVAVGDFKSAAAYFGVAKKAGLFNTPPNEKNKPLWNAFTFSQNLTALEQNWEKEQKIRAAEAKADDLPRVLIKTEKGEIVVELFENEAPNTVANFISLVEQDFYKDKTFHRVIAGFMAQGGDPNGDGTGGPGYMIPDEVANPNHRNHFRGSLSMAKSAAPNSGGSQFFLCFVPTSHLDGVHTVFGRVISGMDVLSKIQRCNDPDNPTSADPDKISEMKVLRKRDHEYTVKKTGE
jgi:cyclophilin family peptidyl-prolyl cis-trans isomerase